MIAVSRATVAIACCALLSLTAVGRAESQTQGSVSVLYAASLVTPMEGRIKTALAAQGIAFEVKAAAAKCLPTSSRRA